MPKVLVLDIEWRPTLAYVWRAWDETISDEQIVEHGGLLCVGAKWVGDKETFVFTEWELGHREMLERIRQMMSEADAIVTYNGDKYDLRKLEGEFVLNRMKLPPPVPSIDLIKTIAKFGYFRKSLGFVGPFLNVGRKLEHEGFRLWKKVIEGNKKAEDKMSKYCAQDVGMTEKLYLFIKPSIKNHPYLGEEADSCRACGSKKIGPRGWSRARVFKTRRYQCKEKDCGHWQLGEKVKI